MLKMRFMFYLYFTFSDSNVCGIWGPCSSHANFVIFYINMIKNNDVRHLLVDFYFTFSINSFPAPSNRLKDLTKYENGITKQKFKQN